MCGKRCEPRGDSPVTPRHSEQSFIPIFQKDGFSLLITSGKNFLFSSLILKPRCRQFWGICVYWHESPNSSEHVINIEWVNWSDKKAHPMCQVFHSTARDMSFVSLLLLITIRSFVPDDHGFSVNHADHQMEGPQVSKRDSTTTTPFFLPNTESLWFRGERHAFCAGFL